MPPRQSGSRKAPWVGAFFLLLGWQQIALAGSCVRPAATEPVLVRYVPDGDTVVLANNRKIRLIGINAPEAQQDDQPAQALVDITSKSAIWSGDSLDQRLRALPAVAIPVSVFAGIYSGYTTVTESAGVAAVASVLVAIFVYREVRPSEIFSMATEGMKAASAVTFIVMFALLFAHWITGSGGATADTFI